MPSKRCRGYAYKIVPLTEEEALSATVHKKDGDGELDRGDGMKWMWVERGGKRPGQTGGHLTPVPVVDVPWTGRGGHGVGVP